MKEELKNKILRYKASFGLTRSNRESIRKECDRLQKKLAIEYIEPKEYIFLRYIAETMEGGGKLNLKDLALKAGFGSWQAERPESTILSKIPDVLYQEIVGIGQKDVEDSLNFLLKQNDDLSVKLRATELAAKIRGMNANDEGVKVNIGNFISK